MITHGPEALKLLPEVAPKAVFTHMGGRDQEFVSVPVVEHAVAVWGYRYSAGSKLMIRSVRLLAEIIDNLKWLILLR